MSQRQTRHARGTGRMLLALVLAVIASVTLVGPAAAHTDLAGSDPAAGATLTTAPTTVTLTFEAAMVDLGATVVITGPDGQQYPTGVPVVDGADVRTEVTALGPNGTYTIGYRVVSGDGHPVDGEIPFQLEVPPAPTPTPASSTVSTPSQTPPSTAAPTTASSTSSTVTSTAVTTTAAGESSGSSGWLWVGVIAVALLVAGAAVVLVRRRHPE
jgi:methionine-rich copper-binding protein CopC